jgi:hypothetical protein
LVRTDLGDARKIACAPDQPLCVGLQPEKETSRLLAWVRPQPDTSIAAVHRVLEIPGGGAESPDSLLRRESPSRSAESAPHQGRQQGEVCPKRVTLMSDWHTKRWLILELDQGCRLRCWIMRCRISRIRMSRRWRPDTYDRRRLSYVAGRYLFCNPAPILNALTRHCATLAKPRPLRRLSWRER